MPGKWRVGAHASTFQQSHTDLPPYICSDLGVRAHQGGDGDALRRERLRVGRRRQAGAAARARGPVRGWFSRRSKWTTLARSINTNLCLDILYTHSFLIVREALPPEEAKPEAAATTAVAEGAKEVSKREAKKAARGAAAAATASKTQKGPLVAVAHFWSVRPSFLRTREMLA